MSTNIDAFMRISVRSKEFLINEKIQIALRVAILFVVGIVVPWMGADHIEVVGYDLSLYGIIAAVFVLNMLYLLYISRYPFKFQKERILFFAVFDVVSSMIVMGHVGEIGAYFAGLFLWYIIGYSMRYDKVVSYLIYITVLLCWTLMITSAPYWIEHKAVAVGWLATYAVIPLYFFKLVEDLKKTIEHLHEDVQKNIYKAQHDPLTDLPNRFSFREELDIRIARKESFALFFIDLDGFKRINDTFGHEVGDRVLIEATRRMSAHDVYVARLGGDEFAAIVEESDKEELAKVAQSFIDAIKAQCDNPAIKLSASIGIARYPEDARDDFGLKKRADMSMYAAKKAGKGRYMFFDDIITPPTN